VATLVNPETTAAPEIDAAAKILSEQRLFVRVYQGQGADVTSISEMIELFPYDLLIIATHCGDVSGHRWTYDFTDSEGIPRKLVVDIALGIGRTEDDDLLQVTQFIRFVTLDGVPWNDREQKAKLYVGTAMTDFMDWTRNRDDEKLRPTIKDTVSRVVGSAAMKMHDNNFIALPRSLANENTPIVINNACVSWHRLASNFMFGGARGYVGTLFPISTTEAEEVLLRALGKHHGKMLPHAFWSAQREAYGDNSRRPYSLRGFTRNASVRPLPTCQPTSRVNSTADATPGRGIATMEDRTMRNASAPSMPMSRFSSVSLSGFSGGGENLGVGGFEPTCGHMEVDPRQPTKRLLWGHSRRSRVVSYVRLFHAIFRLMGLSVPPVLM
jgi:hypothetical protein